MIQSKPYFIIPSIHNLFYATLAIIFGIVSQFYAVPFILLVGTSIIIGVIGFVMRQKTGIIHLLFFLPPASLLLGAFLCTHQLQKQKKFEELVARNSINIQAVVCNIEPIQNARFRYKMLLDLKKIKKATSSEWQNNTNSIVVYLTIYPQACVGDYLEIHSLTFKEIANTSFKNYLAKEKIAATLFLDQLKCTVLYTPRVNLNRMVYYFREALFKTLRKKINKETFQLFSSIFLGNRTAVKKEMDATKEPFKIWGTSHYLARSGLHLVIFVFVWHFIFSLIPLSYFIKQIFLIALIIIYTLLSWSSVSFERALLMFLVCKLCLLTRTPSHYVHLIILVTFIVLCLNPLQLFFLDFQLSFGLTFALAWFNHIQTQKKISS